MAEFSLVAMGGTFDIIHKGHLALLDKAFSVSDNVIIGLVGDELAIKKGKKLNHSYQQRLDTLKKNNDFGPAVLEKDMQALVVSDETGFQGDVLNKIRKEKNLTPVKIVIVPMILAEDGKRISSTRIRNSEIDTQGNLV
ncbi:MAG: pantetheine-phosphate adenylyltransferase [Nitrososphaeria archaeon]|nr:pantetheine-phosphate adenylyltransferase [Nitrososphaeria archaeon]